MGVYKYQNFTRNPTMGSKIISDNVHGQGMVTWNYQSSLQEKYNSNGNVMSTKIKSDSNSNSFIQCVPFKSKSIMENISIASFHHSKLNSEIFLEMYTFYQSTVKDLASYLPEISTLLCRFLFLEASQRKTHA